MFATYHFLNSSMPGVSRNPDANTPPARSFRKSSKSPVLACCLTSSMVMSFSPWSQHDAQSEQDHGKRGDVEGRARRCARHQELPLTRWLVTDMGNRVLRSMPRQRTAPHFPAVRQRPTAQRTECRAQRSIVIGKHLIARGVSVGRSLASCVVGTRIATIVGGSFARCGGNPAWSGGISCRRLRPGHPTCDRRSRR